ncbi:hypothetical protein RRF57_011393 [Xylaria bambusicola]|uniref:Uncharacterized protein n=1 Tax=Xylaria bambusicola TaxID=326684 RepID=A0AAN7UZH1_9PEZI
MVASNAATAVSFFSGRLTTNQVRFAGGANVLSSKEVTTPKFDPAPSMPQKRSEFSMAEEWTRVPFANTMFNPTIQSSASPWV